MANLKVIRKRISSVKSTQKITRAMKLVAGARLTRAQQRIVSLRPYAEGVSGVLQDIAYNIAHSAGHDALSLPVFSEDVHPLLARREEKSILLVVLTSDKGLCGSFNTNICKAAWNIWKAEEAQGKRVDFAIIGRKGRDYFRRRGAPIYHYWENIWGDLSLDTIRPGVRRLLEPFLKKEHDSIKLVYNEFQNAAVQNVAQKTLLPIQYKRSEERTSEIWQSPPLYIVQPDRGTVAEALIPAYVEVTILRALYESTASELGARMTAMDAATKNASDMIGRLTLAYNRARQAAITTELMEVIGGAEALNG